MKLSEAIKLGSMTGPMLKGRLWDEEGGTGSCALGAAMKAVGQERNYYLNGLLKQFGWWWIEETRVSCPVCHTTTPLVDGITYSNTVRNMIPHINNYHNVTREWIADWVATIEPVEMEQQVATTTANNQREEVSVNG